MCIWVGSTHIFIISRLFYVLFQHKGDWPHTYSFFIFTLYVELRFPNKPIYHFFFIAATFDVVFPATVDFVITVTTVERVVEALVQVDGPLLESTWLVVVRAPTCPHVPPILMHTLSLYATSGDVSFFVYNSDHHHRTVELTSSSLLWICACSFNWSTLNF